MMLHLTCRGECGYLLGLKLSTFGYIVFKIILQVIGNSNLQRAQCHVCVILVHDYFPTDFFGTSSGHSKAVQATVSDFCTEKISFIPIGDQMSIAILV
jgi:hypothetical protein